MKVQIGEQIREMTETEYAAHQSALESAVSALETSKSVAKARASALIKLEALGLTPAEVAALVGQ